MPRHAATIRTWGPGGAVMALACLSALLVEGAPADPRLAAAVFPPWWSPTRAAAAAAESGDILGFGLLPTVVILHASRPGLAARARAAGALLILGRSPRGLCIS